MDNHTPRAARRLLPVPIETSRSTKLHGIDSPESYQISLGGYKKMEGDDPRSLEQQNIPFGDTSSSVHSHIGTQEHESESTMTTGRKKRFLPQIIETSTRSSQDSIVRSRAGDGNRSMRTLPPESVRMRDSSSTRLGPATKYRASPEPKETASVTSNSSSQPHQETSTAPGMNQLAKESSRDNAGSKPVRRFFPEPIESVKLSRRQGLHGSENADGGKSAIATDLPDRTLRRLPRKFAPQLIETAKRSFRKGGTRGTLAATGDVDQSLEDLNRPGPARLSRVSYNPSEDREEIVCLAPESRFSYASLIHQHDGRKHSFRVPDLPAIPSNSSEGSEGSNVPSLSTSPSTSSDESARRSKIRDQFRESCDESFSGYLLSLAARSAEKQLRDQALAAFPNEQVHQPVSHFAIDRDDESDGEDQKVEIVIHGIKDKMVSFRRESVADLPWEIEQMRRHKEEAEMRCQEQKNIDIGESRYSAAAIATRQAANKTDVASRAIFLGWQKNTGLMQMRDAASPPMLGADLIFPFSLSPQATTCENSQGLASHHGLDDRKDGGLWYGSPHVEHEDGAGLWMGLCRKDDELCQSASKRLRSGIVTPTPDIDGECYLSLDKIASPKSQLLMTPPELQSSLDHMDKINNLEEEIDREFHDGFVTQVYNYLSLGYPSLARYYDHELSKISGISIDDLRRDDLHTDAKGYVGVPEGGEVKEDDMGGRCMRWTALRLYIREWARQQPQMAGNDSNLDTWGVRERRGSWAV
jgi:hypothetical protein